MRTPVKTSFVLAVIVAIGVGGAPWSMAGPSSVGPDQAFVGSVNGRFGDAAINMACFGPLLPGSTGHPMAGQTLEVLSPPPPIAFGPVKVGYTGSAATSTIARVTQGTTVFARIHLTTYFTTVKIPTTATLPCGGEGVVRFVPRPGSDTAKNGAVTVSFVGQP